MKTHKDISVIENESLEDAAKEYTENGNWTFLMDNNDFIRKESFEAGANWQKQRDSITIQKLVEALNLIIDDAKDWQEYNQMQIESFDGNEAEMQKSIADDIKNRYVHCKQLLKQIEDNKDI